MELGHIQMLSDFCNPFLYCGTSVDSESTKLHKRIECSALFPHLELVVLDNFVHVCALVDSKCYVWASQIEYTANS